MSEPESDPAIGDLQGFLGAGSTCGTCGFRYMEHKGHLIPCPVCRLAALESALVAAREMADYLHGVLQLRPRWVGGKRLLARFTAAMKDVGK